MSRLIEHFDDWRTVDGTVIAFERREVYPEDDAVEVTHLRSVVRLPNVAPAIFTSPPRPRDAAIVGGLSTSFPYRIDGSKIIVEVRVNGQGPFPFVLDTGGHLILTPATARRLGIRAAGSASSLGQGEAVLKAGFARVREIRVGGARMTNQVAKILPLGFRRLERGPRPPKAGWLGLELFERYATTIDPNVHRITLARIDRPRPVPRGERIPIVFDEDAPHVRCTVASHPGSTPETRPRRSSRATGRSGRACRGKHSTGSILGTGIRPRASTLFSVRFAAVVKSRFSRRKQSADRKRRP